MTFINRSDRVLISPPKLSDVRTNNKTNGKKYLNYSDDDVKRLLLEWYESGKTIRQFWMGERLIPRVTLQRHAKFSKLQDLRNDGESVDRARFCVDNYLATLLENKKNRTEKAIEGNKYLADHEEEYIYGLIRMMAAIGYGIGKPEALDIIDQLCFFDVPEIARFDISNHVLDRILSNRKDLKTVAGASLCPQRAVKATVDTRDAMLVKLDAFIQFLNKDGYVPWKSYSDIPKDSIYNMDEVGTDTTKHRGKVLASIWDSIRQYTITPEGDGKMNMHLTCCLTSRADGEF